MTNQITTIDNNTQEIIDNENLSPKVLELVSNYKTGIGKTVEGILAMSKSVSEALKIKNQKEKNVFFNEVNLDRNSSMAKKLKVIGDKYDLFLQNQNSLPPAWTSLYQLTKLEEDNLLKLIEDEVINPTITGTEINKLVGYTPRESVKKALTNNILQLENKEDLEVKIQFKGKDYSKINDFLKSLKLLSQADVLIVKGNYVFNSIEKSITTA